MTHTPYWDEYDLATTTQEFRDRWDAVSAVLSDFDGGLIVESLEKGWTVDETVAQGREDLAERDEDARLADKYDDLSDWDYSLNG